MISKDKQYTTRDGREVRIYATDGKKGASVVHGAINAGDGWIPHSWYEDGRHSWEKSAYDLIEVRPRHQRTVWLNVYDGAKVGGYYEDRCEADERLLSARWPRIACIKVDLDFEEGDGL